MKMMLGNRMIVLALLTVLLYPAMAYAAPLAVVEGGTDFPQTGFPSVGTLDVGVNTVSGHVSGSFPFTVPSGDAFDTFSVNLPAGLRIVKGQIELSGISDGDGDLGFLGALIEPLNETTLINNNVSGGTADLTLHVPYATPGALNVTLQSPSGENFFTSPQFPAGAMTYTLKYTVEATAVPEPATLAFLGLGLGGLMAARRRRP